MSTVIEKLAAIQAAIEAGDTSANLTALDSLANLTALDGLASLTALDGLVSLTALDNLASLVALQSDVAAIKSTVTSYQPYLRYLQELTGSAELQGVEIESLTETQLSSRCKAVNFVFDQLLNVIDTMIAHGVEGYANVYEAVAGGLLVYGLAAISDGPLAFGDVGGVLIGAVSAILLFGVNLSSVKSAIEAARGDIIPALYGAKDTYDAFSAYDSNLTLDEGGKALVKVLLFGSLVKTMYVDGFDYPSGYTPRASTSCLGSTEVYLFDDLESVNTVNATCYVDDQQIVIANNGGDGVDFDSPGIDTSRVVVEIEGSTTADFVLTFYGESGSCSSVSETVSALPATVTLEGTGCQYMLKVTAPATNYTKFDYLRITAELNE